MMINDKVRQAVDDNDPLQVRSALTMVTLLDRGFNGSEFDDSLDYARNVEGLWDEFDKESIKPEEEWDEEYWNYLNASLMDNFCPERIDLLKRVGKKVYPPKAKTVKYPTIPPSPRRPSRPHTQVGMSLPLKVGGAIAVAAIGCATIGVTKTAIAAAIIVGGAIAIQKKGMR